MGSSMKSVLPKRTPTMRRPTSGSRNPRTTVSTSGSSGMGSKRSLYTIQDAWKLRRAPHQPSNGVAADLAALHLRGLIRYAINWRHDLASENPLHFDVYGFVDPNSNGLSRPGSTNAIFRECCFSCEYHRYRSCRGASVQACGYHPIENRKYNWM